MERLTHPYVTRDSLDSTFGAKADEVASRFFVETEKKGILTFRPKFATEKAVQSMEVSLIVYLCMSVHVLDHC
jgi:hypothetical protein